MGNRNNILSLLGLALRGGNLVLGEEPVGDAALEKNARLILLAADAARNGIVQAGDATRIMTKWFLLAESGDPEEAWAKWLEMVDEIHENQ